MVTMKTTQTSQKELHRGHRVIVAIVSEPWLVQESTATDNY